MEFEWNARKHNDNIDKHGIRFDEAKLIWQGPLLILPDNRRDYGEDRYVAFGILGGSTVLAVVFTYRGERIRLISARRAKAKERKRFYETI